MKKIRFILSLVVLTAFLIASCDTVLQEAKKLYNKNEKSNVIKSDVTIGGQIWMAENLNADKFRNGDPIPQAKTESEWKAYSQAREAAWCYYDKKDENGTTYGKLYNWYAVNDARGLAPLGYHIPTDAEWKMLIDFLGGHEISGPKLKSTEGWDSNKNGTNSSGFSGLPGGSCYFNGTFVDIGKSGYWWSATDNGSANAWFCTFPYGDGLVSRNSGSKGKGLSVRCLKD